MSKDDKYMQNNSKLKLTIIISILLFTHWTHALVSTSSSGGNPFNKLQDPETGVNLFTGTVVHPQQLFSLDGGVDLSIDASLMYSSNVYNQVRAKNDVAPTSWVGLGWSLGYGQIYCDHNGTLNYNDNSYYWKSPQGVSVRIIEQWDEATKKPKFFIQNKPFWKVERFPAIMIEEEPRIQGWILTDENGKRYIYGDPNSIRPGNDAIWHTICWENYDGEIGGGKNGYIGSGSEGANNNPLQLPYMWDLAAEENVYGGTIEYMYEKIRKPLFVGDWISQVYYTHESYIKSIKAKNGNEIVFHHSSKNKLEYLDPKNYKSEPDAYIDPYQTQYLDSINVYVNGHHQSNYLFCYYSINLFEGKHYEKRLLQSVSKRAVVKNDKRELIARTIYKYLDDVKKAKESSEDYHLGALKQIITPDCGIVSYEYEKMDTPSSKKATFDLTKLQGDELISINQGVTSAGNEYFLIRYRKKHNNADHVFTESYTWVGTFWKNQKVGQPTPYNQFHGKDAHTGTDYYLLRKGVYIEAYFWNEKNLEWEVGFSDRFEDDSVRTNGSGLVYRINYGSVAAHNFRIYTLSLDKKSDWKNATDWITPPGFYNSETLHCVKNHAVIWDRERSPEMGNTGVSVITYSGGEVSTQTFEAQSGEFISMALSNNYIVLGYQPGHQEFVKVLSWTGKIWREVCQKRVKRGNKMQIYAGNDYFCVYHPFQDNLSYFDFNGEEWRCVTANKNFSSKESSILPGKDFFVVRKTEKKRKGRCRPNRRKEHFEIYKRDGNSWSVPNLKYVHLGERREKMYGVGNNFIVFGRMTHNTKRHLAPYLKATAVMSNGENWNKWEWIYDRECEYGRNVQPEVYVNNNAILFKEKMHDVGVGQCGKNRIRNHRKTVLEIARKDDDSFGGVVKVFVIKKKTVTDEISKRALVTEYSYSSINDLYLPSKFRYNSNSKSAMFGMVDVYSYGVNSKPDPEKLSEKENGTRSRHFFEMQKPDMFGLKTAVEKGGAYVVHKEPLYPDGLAFNTFHREEMTYIDRLLNNPAYPEGVTCIRLSEKTTTTHGLKKTVSMKYSLSNGKIKEIRSTNSDGVSKIIRDNFAVLEPNFPLQQEFKDKNLLAPICQSTILEQEDGKPEKVLKSTASTWYYDSECRAYKPKASYIWDVKPGVNGKLPALTSFNYADPDGQSAWKKVKEYTKYSDRGVAIEIRDNTGYKDGTDVERALFYGHSGNLRIAEISQASHDECAFLTCDHVSVDDSWILGDAVLNKSPKEHFNDSTLYFSKGSISTNGITQYIEGVKTEKDYLFSLWVYPVNAVEENVILFVSKGTSNQDALYMKEKLTVGEWNLVSKKISKEYLSDIQSHNGKILISVTPGVDAEIYVEDLRFHPELTFPITYYFDTNNVVTCIVDGFNNNINIEYDWQGRKVKEYKRDTKGKADTVYAEYDFHIKSCASTSGGGLKLKDLATDEIDLRFDPDINIYRQTVGNEVEKVVLDAIAQNAQAYLKLYKDGQKIFESDCPCGLSEEIGLDEAATTELEVEVSEGIEENELNNYEVHLRRLSNCWAFAGNSDITEGEVDLTELSTIEDEPCLAYKDRTSNEVMVKCLNGDDWEIVGGSPASEGAAQEMAFCSDDATLYVAYTDLNDDGLLKIRKADGKAGPWSAMGGVASVSWPQQIDIEKSDSRLIVAYTANNSLELNLPEEKENLTLFIKEWNESSETWDEILPRPQIINIPHNGFEGSVNNFDLSIAEDGTLYIAYKRNAIIIDPDENLEGDGDHAKLFLLKYNTATSQWEELGTKPDGTGPVSDGTTNNLSLVINNNVPYLAYNQKLTLFEKTFFKDKTTETKLLAKMYQGGAWADVDTEEPVIFKSDGSELFTLSFVNNEPFISFLNNFNKNKLTAIHYNGNEWKSFGNPAFAQSYNGVMNRLGVAEKSGSIPLVSYGNERKDKSTSVMDFTNPCGDANLKSITITACGEQRPLFPEFDQYIVNYEAQIKPSCPKVTISVETRNTLNPPEVFINGSNTSATTADVAVEPGEKVIPIYVETDDGAFAIYKVKVHRSPDNFASLCFVELYDKDKNKITYTPEFDPNIFSYSTTVSSDIDLVYIVPIVEKKVSISINGTENPPDAVSSEVKLKYGVNKIPITIISEDQQTAIEYVITVIREIDLDVMLTSLQVKPSGAAVSIPLVNTSSDYSVSLLSSETQITITAVLQNNDATMYLNHRNGSGWEEMQSGVTSEAINLDYGKNIVLIKLYGPSNTKIITYKITAIREPGTDCQISSMTIFDDNNPQQEIQLNPAFSPNVLDYEATSPVGTDVHEISLVLNYGDANTQATLIDKYTGALKVIESGSITQKIGSGKNVLEILVLNEVADKTATYQVTIEKEREIIIPEVFFATESSEELESVGGLAKRTIYLDVKLSVAPLDDQTTVSYTIKGGTATPAGQTDPDYELLGEGDLVFELCESGKQIAIDIFDDELIEGDETIIVELYIPTGGTNVVLGDTPEHTVTIIDDDFPKLSFDGFSTSVIEGDEGDPVNLVTVGLTMSDVPPEDKEVKINVAHESSGLDETDYAILTPSLTFTASQLNNHIDIQIIPDNVPEDDEYFILDYTLPKGVNKGEYSQYKVTILNDDLPIGPIVYVDQSATTGDDDGTSWKDAFLNLQDALDCARNNSIVEEIRVAAGTYYPDQANHMIVEEGRREETFSMVGGVKLVGGYSNGGSEHADPFSNETTLSGNIGNESINTDNSYHVMVVGIESDINGFTISDGNADGPTAYNQSGGGCLVSDNSTRVIIDNCIFEDNEAYDGGACYISYAHSVELETNETTFRNNRASRFGGAILAFGFSNISFTSCQFVQNSVLNGNGGALHLEVALKRDGVNSLVNCLGCTFDQNTALNNEDNRGGAVHINGAVSSNIVNGLFINNNCDGDGGAINYYPYEEALGHQITNSIFYNNKARNAGAINVAFSSNGPATHINVVNCTFNKNNANYQGAAIKFNDGKNGESFTLSNAILWGNLIEGGPSQNDIEIENGIMNIVDSDLEQISIPGANLTNVIHFNPNFTGTASHDQLTLQQNSVCVNRGNASHLPQDEFDLNNNNNTTELIPFDFSQENARIQHGEVDMGAYESPYEQTMFIVHVDAEENGSVDPEGNQPVQQNGTLTVVADPAPGYQFTEWVVTDNVQINNSGAQGEFTISGNGNIVATFHNADVTVTFDAQGGSPTPSSQTVPYNGLLTEPSTQPTRAGATFAGWNTNINGSGDQWNFATDRATANRTLYANWTLDIYTVTFDSKGGTTVQEQSAGYQGKIAEPDPAPTKPGYIFDGWYEDEAYQNAWDFPTGEVTSNMTLYAKWNPRQYLITFDQQLGSGGSDNVTATYEQAMPTAIGPSRVGYTFEGYFDAQFGGGKQYYDKNMGGIEVWDKRNPATLYAYWIPRTYLITFNKHGGENGSDYVTATFDEAMPEASAPSKEHYIFQGYYEFENGGGEQYYNSTMLIRNVWNKASTATLHAHWTPVQFTLTVNSVEHCTTNPTGNVTVYHGVSTPIEATVDDGYHFVGWTAVAGSNYVFFGNPADPSSNVYLRGGDGTIRAMVDPNAYTITFNPRSGTTPNPQYKDVNFGENYGPLPTTTRNGFAFAGWYTEINGNGDLITSATELTEDSDHTLYAHWTQMYTISFRDVSGSGDENGGTKSFAVKISPTPNEVITVDFTLGGDAEFGSDYNNLYPSNRTVTFYADDDTRYVNFDHINNYENDGNREIIFTLTDPSPSAKAQIGTNNTYTYTIIDNEYTITLASGYGGSTFPEEKTHVWEAGGNGFIEAIPDDGYYFDRWEVNNSSNINGFNSDAASQQVSISGDVYVTAYFTQKYTIDFSMIEGESWEGSGTYTFYMDIDPTPNETITADFSLGGTAIEHEHYNNLNPSNKIVTFNSGQSYKSLQFNSIQNDNVGGDRTMEFTINNTWPSNITQIGTDRTYSHTIHDDDCRVTIQSDDNGSTVPPEQQYIWENGSTHHIEANPYFGYRFGRWEVDNSSNVSFSEGYFDESQTITIEGDVTITATFVPNVYTDLYVDGTANGNNDGSSWENAFTKLQTALSLARKFSGAVSTIHIAEGNYYPDEGVDQDGNPIFNNDRNQSFLFDFNEGSRYIYIYGGYPSSPDAGAVANPDIYITTLTGDIDKNQTLSGNSYNVVRSTVNNYLYLNGITISDGNANGSLDTTQRGAAVHGYTEIGHSSAGVRMEKCNVINNYAQSGACVYNPLKLENCYFENNESNEGKGGAVYADKEFYWVENCIFINNRINSGNGGAIYINDSYRYNLSFKNCTFDNNYATNGGALFFYWRLPEFLRCSFLNNTASDEGGAIWAWVDSSDYSRAASCVFYGNAANGGNGGGAIYLNRSMAENKSSTFENCTFVSNAAEGHGGAFWVDENINVDSRNSIFWNNINASTGAPDIYLSGGTAYVSNCVTQQMDLITSYNESFNFYPKFITMDKNHGLFLRLNENSPCRNTGDQNMNWGGDGLDRAGNNRVFSSNVDMGAYESSFTGEETVRLEIVPVSESHWGEVMEVEIDGVVRRTAWVIPGRTVDIKFIPKTNPVDFYEWTLEEFNDNHILIQNTDNTTTTATIIVNDGSPFTIYPNYSYP